MRKPSKLKDAKRFKWIIELSGRVAARLWIRDDGSAAKITYSDDLTPEELVQVGDWLKKVSKDLKKIREDGWSNATGRVLSKTSYGAKP